MSTYLLGIDVGTSACKTALFNLDGSVAAVNSEEYNIYYPGSGMIEQNPDEWWQAVCDSVKNMIDKNKIQPSDIAGIGIDGQSWSAIMINKNGEVLHNTPIWMDSRSGEICEEIKKNIGENQIFDLCGNPFQPGYTLPKILWYKKNLPALYSETYKILQSNSFIAYRLTGNITQDISQCYGLHCFDMRKGAWDDAMCKTLSVSAGILPDIYQCHNIIGSVTKEATEKCGLTVGTPVVAGGLDAACGTLGAGVYKAGETQEHGGQSGGMSVCIDEYKADKRLILTYHVIPGKWLLQGGTVGGGSVIKWMKNEILNGIFDSFSQMDADAEKIPPASNGVLFLPYMAGERSPIWDSRAKGVFYGLDFSKNRAHMIRAVLEGSVFALRHNLEVAEEAGVYVKTMNSMGGAANSRLWTQMKADITGKEIAVPSSDTATTLGAAILAGVGIGVYSNFEDAISKTINIKDRYTPDSSKKEIYDVAYDKYIKLYENLKNFMKLT